MVCPLSLYEIDYYSKPNGFCPFIEWLDGQDLKIQQRILARLDRVRCGNFGDHKTVSKGLYELRFHFSSGLRVYYKIEDQKVVIILTGSDKKDQKKQIELAQTYATGGSND